MNTKKPRAHSSGRTRGPATLKRREAWLELRGGSWRGPPHLIAFWLAEDVRRARSKAERLQIAADLEELSAFLAAQVRTVRSGRPREVNTWERFGLALVLVQRYGLRHGTAASAVAGRNKDLADRVRKLIGSWERGNTGSGIPSFKQVELDQVVKQLNLRKN